MLNDVISQIGRNLEEVQQEQSTNERLLPGFGKPNPGQQIKKVINNSIVLRYDIKKGINLRAKMQSKGGLQRNLDEVPAEIAQLQERIRLLEEENARLSESANSRLLAGKGKI